MFWNPTKGAEENICSRQNSIKVNGFYFQPVAFTAKTKGSSCYELESLSNLPSVLFKFFLFSAVVLLIITHVMIDFVPVVFLE